MSASTGEVLYDRPFSFPPASIAFCRGRAKRDPSAGVFRSKSASFRQFQWRGESLGEARSAVGFVGKQYLVQSIYTSCLPMVKFASVCEFDGCLHLAT